MYSFELVSSSKNLIFKNNNVIIHKRFLFKADIHVYPNFMEILMIGFYCVLLVTSKFFSRSQHKKEIKYIMGMGKGLTFFVKLCFDSLNK